MIKQILLDYNRGALDYDNINLLQIDAGAGGVFGRTKALRCPDYRRKRELEPGQQQPGRHPTQRQRVGGAHRTGRQSDGAAAARRILEGDGGRQAVDVAAAAGRAV